MYCDYCWFLVLFLVRRLEIVVLQTVCLWVTICCLLLLIALLFTIRYLGTVSALFSEANHMPTFAGVRCLFCYAERVEFSLPKSSTTGLLVFLWDTVSIFYLILIYAECIKSCNFLLFYSLVSLTHISVTLYLDHITVKCHHTAAFASWC